MQYLSANWLPGQVKSSDGSESVNLNATNKCQLVTWSGLDCCIGFIIVSLAQENYNIETFPYLMISIT